MGESCPSLLAVGQQLCFQAAGQLCDSHGSNATNNSSATTLGQNFNEALKPQKGLCVTELNRTGLKEQEGFTSYLRVETSWEAKKGALKMHDVKRHFTECKH